jgi:hypothetical protein
LGYILGQVHVSRIAFSPLLMASLPYVTQDAGAAARKP